MGRGRGLTHLVAVCLGFRVSKTAQGGSTGTAPCVQCASVGRSPPERIVHARGDRDGGWRWRGYGQGDDKIDDSDLGVGVGVGDGEKTARFQKFVLPRPLA